MIEVCNCDLLPVTPIVRDRCPACAAMPVAPASPSSAEGSHHAAAEEELPVQCHCSSSLQQQQPDDLHHSDSISDCDIASVSACDSQTSERCPSNLQLEAPPSPTSTSSMHEHDHKQQQQRGGAIHQDLPDHHAEPLAGLGKQQSAAAALLAKMDMMLPLAAPGGAGGGAMRRSCSVSSLSNMRSPVAYAGGLGLA